MDLILVPENAIIDASVQLPEAVRDVLKQTANHYRTAGFTPPWIGYLGKVDDEIVGSCAFVEAPVNGEVEIAYYTFPAYEGRGVATMMAAKLIHLANAVAPEIRVKAHTLPENNASTSILKKHGFEFSGAVTHPIDGLIWVWRLERPNS